MEFSTKLTHEDRVATTVEAVQRVLNMLVDPEDPRVSREELIEDQGNDCPRTTLLLGVINPRKPGIQGPELMYRGEMNRETSAVIGSTPVALLFSGTDRVTIPLMPGEPMKVNTEMLAQMSPKDLWLTRHLANLFPDQPNLAATNAGADSEAA